MSESPSECRWPRAVTGRIQKCANQSAGTDRRAHVQSDLFTFAAFDSEDQMARERKSLQQRQMGGKETGLDPGGPPARLVLPGKRSRRPVLGTMRVWAPSLLDCQLFFVGVCSISPYPCFVIVLCNSCKCFSTRRPLQTHKRRNT